MNKSIKEFIEAKKKGEDRTFESHSIQLIDSKTKEIIEGWIQDVEVSISNIEIKEPGKQTIETVKYILECIILDKNRRKFHSLRKVCIAPVGCIIDWDSLQCSSF